MCLLFIPCLTHFICIDLTLLPHFKQPIFPRTADSVVIQHRLSVSLWDDPSRLHRVREAADGDASALASRSCSSDAILESFKNIYPAKRWYTLNGASLVRVPPQLYGHKSGERELPHCSERPNKTERRAWLSHCDRSCGSNALRDEATLWQANKSTTWANWNTKKCRKRERQRHSLKSLRVETDPTYFKREGRILPLCGGKCAPLK